MEVLKYIERSDLEKIVFLEGYVKELKKKLKRKSAQNGELSDIIGMFKSDLKEANRDVSKVFTYKRNVKDGNRRARVLTGLLRMEELKGIRLGMRVAELEIELNIERLKNN